MVMYRDFATRAARRLGLTGNVHNEVNGTVTVVAEGEEAELLTYIGDLQKGSLFSAVENVHVRWEDASEEFTDFTIRF
jgi:acylphosphatase